ncbi:hypothetical protein ABZ569_01620 [Streptomyces albus]|uniref:hypothetical protein n=1 Tax=Streptomyces albus TaxID=1888 RepID=UPI0033F976D1
MSTDVTEPADTGLPLGAETREGSPAGAGGSGAGASEGGPAEDGTSEGGSAEAGGSKEGALQDGTPKDGGGKKSSAGGSAQGRAEDGAPAGGAGRGDAREAGAPAGGAGPDAAAGGGPRPTRRALWTAGLLAAALLFCACAGWLHWRAHTDADLAHSRARDQALAAGRTHLATLNTIDAGHITAGLRDWRAATTGPLRDQLRRSAAKDAAALRERGTDTRARVTAAALTGLDTRAGTATLIATVRISTSTRAGSPATDRKRMRAGLERTPDGWKLTSLAPVPVGEGN